MWMNLWFNIMTILIGEEKMAEKVHPLQYLGSDQDDVHRACDKMSKIFDEKTDSFLSPPSNSSTSENHSVIDDSTMEMFWGIIAAPATRAMTTTKFQQLLVNFINASVTSAYKILTGFEEHEKGKFIEDLNDIAYLYDSPIVSDIKIRLLEIAQPVLSELFTNEMRRKAVFRILEEIRVTFQQMDFRGGVSTCSEFIKFTKGEIIMTAEDPSCSGAASEGGFAFSVPSEKGPDSGAA